MEQGIIKGVPEMKKTTPIESSNNPARVRHICNAGRGWSGTAAPLFIIIILLHTGAAAAAPTKTYRVTAYCPCPKCCGQYGWGYTTANGYKIKTGDRFVAAPKNIPFGTKLVIKGYNNGKPVEVKDRGGAIKGNRLDVYFDDHQTALNWGVKYIEIAL